MEIQRKKYIDAHGYFEQSPFDTPVNASQMNIFYQVPQYVLQGTGEVLTSIPGERRVSERKSVVFGGGLAPLAQRIECYR